MKSVLTALFLLSFATGVQAQAKIDRPGFYLEYPVSWLIDKSAPGYSPDGLFTINADPNNNIMFMIIEGKVDPVMMLDVQEEEYKKRMLTNPSVASRFSAWGSFKGTGRELKGKLLGKWPGIVRMFVVQAGNRTLMVTIQTLETDVRKLSPGFAVIEKSFRLK